MWVVKDLMDTLLENTLHVQLKLYLLEWYSFYRNVPTVVKFHVSGEFNIENAWRRIKERLFKECLLTHISLTRQTHVLFVILHICCQVKNLIRRNTLPNISSINMWSRLWWRIPVLVNSVPLALVAPNVEEQFIVSCTEGCWTPFTQNTRFVI